MIDFHAQREVKATKVRRFCAHCEAAIEIGETATRYAGAYSGDFSMFFCHPECAAAGDALNQEHNLEWKRNDGGEYWWLNEVEDLPNLEWLLKHHPAAADRMQIAPRLMKAAMTGQTDAPVGVWAGDDASPQSEEK